MHKLKAELSERGLPTSGLKAVLIERLQAALLREPAATAPAAAGATPTHKPAASKAAAPKAAAPRAAASKPLAAKRGPASSGATAKRPKAAAGGGGAAEGATTRREEAAWARGVELCIGCDEAGRGPLAGPVVAAACALPAAAPRIPGVSDSKTIGDEAGRSMVT